MNKQNYNHPQWFLIYTKPQQEERAKENLENQGNEVFLPMIATQNKTKSKSLSLRPMFPRYLFAKFRVEKNNWTHIKSTRGVSEIIIFDKNFKGVPNSVMNYLKSKVNENSFVVLEAKKKEFKKGDELIIKKGAFQGKEATFLYLSGKERVKVLLSLMNQLLVTEVSEKNIESKSIIETFKL